MAYRALFTCQALCALALSIVGCGADGRPPGPGPDEGTEGEIGNAAFGYRCVSDSDPACAADANFANSYTKVLPPKIAVGSSFGIGFIYGSQSALDGSVVMSAVSSEQLASTFDSGAVFTAKKPGFAGIVGRRGSVTVDLVHVHVVGVSQVSISSSAGSPVGTEFDEVGTGAQVTLRALPLDGAGEWLAGSLGYAWTSSDPSVIEILTSDSTDEITVRGAKPGQATVKVTTSGVSSSIVFHVLDQTSGAGGAGGEGGSGVGGAGGAGGGAGGGGGS